jgi:hypothetical protein
MCKIRYRSDLLLVFQCCDAPNKGAMIEDAEERMVFIELDGRIDSVNAHNGTAAVRSVERFCDDGNGVSAEERRASESHACQATARTHKRVVFVP